jgi:hypothetical protein
MSPSKQCRLVSDLTRNLLEAEQEVYEITKETMLAGSISREQELRLVRVLGRADALIYMLTKAKSDGEETRRNLTAIPGGCQRTPKRNVKLRNIV